MLYSTFLPNGATDCHVHVFQDVVRFPMSDARRYTPPPASIEQLQKLHRDIGINRVVLVQPSVYGADNAAMLEALRVLGQERARGVAVIDESISDVELNSMAALGVCGVRVNLEIDGERDRRRAEAHLRRAIDKVAPRGWHIQIFTSLQLIAECYELLCTAPVPLVFDHYGGACASAGLSQPGLAEMLKLVECGQAYVKLSAPYRCSNRADYEDLESLTHRLVLTNSRRLLWGSDWPHPQPGVRLRQQDISPPYEVDLRQVLNTLFHWIANPVAVQRVFVDNPQELYKF